MNAMTKYNIIPKPNHYTCGNSEYVVSSGTAVLCPEEFVGVGKYLTEYLKTKPVENEGEIKIKKTPELSHDEYELHITNEGIIIKASTYSGAFYGAVTLKMILMQAEKRDGKAIVKTLIIKDKPENEYRGLMLDVSRHYFTVDEIKDLIENMAFLKLNKFHWHLSDDQGFRIESKLYPELTEIGAKRTSKHLKGYGLENDNVEEARYYTQEEVKDIVAFADRLGVEVIPEIDIPGHTTAILASIPELSCKSELVEVMIINGVSDGILCAGNEKTFEFLDKLLGEITALFPSKKFHIGGDEAFKGYKVWDECEKCKALKEKLGLKESKDLQIWFMNRVAEILKKYGKTAVAWDDCMGDALDKSIECQLWRPNAIGKVRKLATERNIIISPTTYFYFDNKYSFVSLRKVYKFNKVKVGFTRPEQKSTGIECELWTEWIDSKEALDFAVFPRTVAFAEVAWTNLENRRYKDFLKRLEWFKVYMKKRNINYSRVYNNLINLDPKCAYHLGSDGKEYAKSEKLKNAE